MRDIDIEGAIFVSSMRVLRFLAVSMFLVGAAILAYAIITGQMQFALAFFFIPIIYGSSLLGGAAIGLMVLGIFTYMADLFVHSGREEDVPSQERGQREGGQTKKEFGGVVLVGPIPIVFGSSNRAALYAVITAIAVLILLLLALFYL